MSHLCGANAKFSTNSVTQTKRITVLTYDFAKLTIEIMEEEKSSSSVLSLVEILKELGCVRKVIRWKVSRDRWKVSRDRWKVSRDVTLVYPGAKSTGIYPETDNKGG
jgi:hypothetical protein